MVEYSEHAASASVSLVEKKQPPNNKPFKEAETLIEGKMP